METFVRLDLKRGTLKEFLIYKFGVKTPKKTVVIINDYLLNSLIINNLIKEKDKDHILTNRIIGKRTYQIESIYLSLPYQFDNIRLSRYGHTIVEQYLYDKYFIPILIGKMDKMLANQTYSTIEAGIEIFMANNGIMYTSAAHESLRKAFYRFRIRYYDILRKHIYEKDHIPATLNNLKRQRRKSVKNRVEVNWESLFQFDWKDE